MKSASTYETATDLAPQYERFASTLKQNKRSATKQRQEVFASLLDGPRLPTALADKLATKLDRATVYRTLELFERLGIVNRIWQDGQYKVELSEIFVPHHHHALCQNCGAITDIASSELESMLSSLAKKQGFLAVDHSVELRGYCADCNRS